MRRGAVLSILATLAFTTAALGDPTATVTLESSQAGQTVSAGATIDWTLKVAVSTGDNEGLALISCDLVQDAANPAYLDLPPADAVPGPMANFSRPTGISNPGETDPTTGYIGVQRGDAGQMNLIQIGGGQNTFGEAGGVMGTNPVVVPAVGQGGSPETVASGSFAAPAAGGTYVFRVENALANVCTEINTPPAYSPVVAATVDATGATITFTVSAYEVGDLNCDGAINAFDIDPFVLALGDPAGYAARVPGLRHDARRRQWRRPRECLRHRPVRGPAGRRRLIPD